MADTVESRSILITGCSSGIGYDAAHALAERGWRVFADCHKEEDCSRLRNYGLESVRLDYEDEASIETAVRTVAESTGGRVLQCCSVLGLIGIRWRGAPMLRPSSQ